MTFLPKARLPLLAAALLAALALIAGCGGDSADESTDPQELLTETFSGEGEVESGVLDISINAGAGGEAGGSLTGSISGPFQARAEDQVPLIDMTATLEVSGAGPAQGFDGAITVTEDSAYVTTGGQAYQVDEATFAALEQAYAQSAAEQAEGAEEGAALFGQLGIDPSTWITDVTNEGVEEIEGEETVHISGTPDVARIFEDAQRLDPTGTAAGGTGQLAEAVESASVDIYTGAEDKILRRVDLSLSLVDPGKSGDTLALDLSIGISGVNEDQEIEAPADAQPLDELIPGGLGGLGGLTPGDLGGLEGLGGGGAGLDDLGGSAEYRECVAAAGSPDELAACAELL